MPDPDYPPTPEEILSAAAELLDAYVRPDGLRLGLQEVLAAYRSRATRGGKAVVPPLARIPALVHGAVTGEYAPALPLCGMALLSYLGIGLLDHLMDGDRNNFWQGASPAETVLVATTLACVIPPAVIASLDLGPAAAVRMQRTFSGALLRMADGQRADVLSFRNYALQPDEVERFVAEKSGAFTGCLAELGALRAGAPACEIESYGDWGRGYGTADQLRSDLGDLFVDGAGSDLRSGSVTHPLACLIEATRAEARPGVLTTIADAADDPGALARLRSALQEGGIVNITAMTISWHVEAARTALTRATARSPYREALLAMITRIVPG